MFDAETRTVAAQIADRLSVPLAALLAVAEVESGGRVLARVNGRDEPLIRFEGHYFDRFLLGDGLLQARAEGLANPLPGAVKNPGSQAGRWILLNRAIAINRIAALSSTSWGLGQVMGSHWQWLGYGSVDALVAEARSGVAGQLNLMASYIEKAGLVKALQERDWQSFARTYNGPGYARNKYDTKMAAAFRRFSREAGEAALPVVVDEAAENLEEYLMFGSRGAKVKQVQAGLTRLGYALVADGLYGLVTDRVVRQFQRDHLLEETGIVGKAEAALILSHSSGRGWALRSVLEKLNGTANSEAAGSLTPNGLRRWSLTKGLRKALLSISGRIA